MPAPALRLTPVIQQAVVGVPVQPVLASRPVLPLFAITPALGLLTPGFILGTDLARPIPTDPAYAPIGYRIGTFTVLPTFAQSIGYDSNPDQTNRQAARGSVALRTEAAVDFRSDWSSSSLQGALRGSYLETPQNEAASRPAADGTVRLRIDVNRDLHCRRRGPLPRRHAAHVEPQPSGRRGHEPAAARRLRRVARRHGDVQSGSP